VSLQVGRIKQKRGYKDQWPWNIKIYTDENGNNKGDACLAYEDPSAAHSAGGFYNSIDHATVSQFLFSTVFLNKLPGKCCGELLFYFVFLCWFSRL